MMLLFNLRKVLFFITLIISSQVISQKELVINELDSDTPGLDTHEFVELRSSKPNFPLDDFVIVFFNGSANAGNASYLSLDLDGYQTDVNGIFLIGTTNVVPFPQFLIAENTIQNGEDAVAIYKASASEFPLGTIAIADNRLVDVLVYGTNDPDAVSMLQIFRSFDPNIKQINEGSTNNTNSIQRKNDGTYYTGLPTPRKLNDGSGITFTGIRTTFSKPKFTEGDTITITFQADQNTETEISLEFSLANGPFNQQDFSGPLKVLFPKNTNSISSKIVLIDDQKDEGDEEIIYKLSPLPDKYLILNNNIKIRVEDNDFKILGFGTPLNPTYGKIKGQYDDNYYKPLHGKSGNELKNSLQSIIANPNLVRAQTYNDVLDILKEADQNPENSNQVWLVYSEKGRSKLDLQSTSDNTNVWNREHVWPRSRGGFNSTEGDDQFNGKDVFWISGPDSLRHANSDGYNIRAEDGSENSNRGNKFYGQYSGPQGTKGKFKGDVARSIFYLAVRYNGLEIVSGYPENQVGKFGDIDTLLAWHRQDPPDDFEMNRNNIIFTWQRNRNPFVDLPDLVEYIYGNKKSLNFELKSNSKEVNKAKFEIFPNPSSREIHIKGITEQTDILIFDIKGQIVHTVNAAEDLTITFPLVKGNYIIKLNSKHSSASIPVIIY